MLYTLHVVPVAAAVIGSFTVNQMQYADDTQAYVALHSTDATTNTGRCFQEVLQWFMLNGLSLN